MAERLRLGRKGETMTFTEFATAAQGLFPGVTIIVRVERIIGGICDPGPIFQIYDGGRQHAISGATPEQALARARAMLEVPAEGTADCSLA